MAIAGRLPSTWTELSTLLFDLDGTLVDMRPIELELSFFPYLMARFRHHIPIWRFRAAFWEAARLMQAHRSERTNYDVFLDALAAYAPAGRPAVERAAGLAMTRDFARMRRFFRPVPGARETLLGAASLGYRLVVATNPVWPLAGVRHRIAFGGLADVPFEFVASSETMTRTKPDPAYYAEILARIGARPDECLMIGNDPKKDLPARDVGIRTFLLDRPRARRPVRDWQTDPRLDGWGSHAGLLEVIRGWSPGRGPGRAGPTS